MSTAKVIPFAPESLESTAAMERYRLAYHVAESAMNFAETVKLVGIFVAGLLVMTALMVFQWNPEERFGFPVISVSLVAGAVFVVLAAHIWGMVFRIQGRTLEAAIDSAVNTSPWLSPAQRAQAMSLPRETASVEVIRKSAV